MDTKLKHFIQKTAADFKRFGQDVRGEAQKLMQEVKDPKHQQKLKEGIEDVGKWVRRASEDIATIMEMSAQKAEKALQRASSQVTHLVTRVSAAKAASSGTSTASSKRTASKKSASKRASPKKASQKAAPQKKSSARTKKPAARAKKTIGKKI